MIMDNQFIENNPNYELLKHYFDNEILNKILNEHSDVIEHLINSNEIYTFINYLNNDNNSYESFVEKFKQFFLDNYVNTFEYNFRIPIDGKITYNIPSWINSMHFNFIEGINNSNDLLNYNLNTVILNENQQNIINMLGIDNIKKINEETGIFSHKTHDYSSGLDIFDAFSAYFSMRFKVTNNKINFKNGTLTYDEFRIEFAKCLDIMRSNNLFTDFPNYDFISGNFRSDFPEIFIDLNAPSELREAFYKNNITSLFLYNHSEYIEYLLDKNLENTIRINIELGIAGAYDDNNYVLPMNVNFIEEYTKRYGNSELLKLISIYGNTLDELKIPSFHNEIDSKEQIEKNLMAAVYNKIVNNRINYIHLLNIPEFVNAYPDIFLDMTKVDSINWLNDIDKQNFINAFYNQELTFDDIKKYPDLINVLKDKNLYVAFSKYKKVDRQAIVFRNNLIKNNDLSLISVFGNEEFLKLCQKYGHYMDNYMRLLDKYITINNNKCYYKGNDKKELTIDSISKMIENVLYLEIAFGRMSYDEDAPEYLKRNYPQLFLDDNAPNELKQYFYNKNGCLLSFNILSNHKEWLPYLTNKDIQTSLLRGTNNKGRMFEYFQIFGPDRAIKLGIMRSETVTAMINMDKSQLMKEWYDLTGEKFIPDIVIMQNFRLANADKFLSSSFNWSRLMKISEYANHLEGRDAMLKLAYSFGAFDGDNRGYKKVYDLLTGIPKKISNTHSHVIEDINKTIWMYKNNLQPGNYYNFDMETINKLQDSLLKEKVNVNILENGFNEIYRLNEDGSYTLIINEQNAPKSCAIIKSILNKYSALPILTSDKAHKLFGGFELKYDPYFREFLLANMDDILASPECVTYIASIQKQFSDIRTINSNRVLTLNLAISYVQSNKYTGVNTGNEKVSEIAATAGYSQQDFNTLQQIYNHGKQRTFSSIPRVEKKLDKYSYEMLRLDDPLAMAIGTLSDCCQELGNVAEVCMEHSMTSSDGRVFVVRDNEGNIVSQSWVWRNRDVLCFDNIEIPDKAFKRAGKSSSELSRSDFTDEVYNVYKEAAHELIMEDEKIYKQLLVSGKITEDEYNGLRLSKVTVGLGYNDIAESIKQNAKNDTSELSRPLEYTPPVELSRGLYTNDSTTQYILEERSGRLPYDGDTLPVHHDEYQIYDDSNLNKKQLLTLEKLEIVTKGNSLNLDTDVIDYTNDKYVSEIGANYGLNKDKTKIVMNPNFAIIYEEDDKKIKIASLLFNTYIDNHKQQIDITDKVVIQIKLALDQIGYGKEIDVSLLPNNQKEMYEKAINIKDEIDNERGIGHGKQNR